MDTFSSRVENLSIAMEMLSNVNIYQKGWVISIIFEIFLLLGHIYDSISRVKCIKIIEIKQIKKNDVCHMQITLIELPKTFIKNLLISAESFVWKIYCDVTIRVKFFQTYLIYLQFRN